MNNINNNNLVRVLSWFNPFSAKINNNFYELNNIIIYSEFGDIYNSGCGWFRPECGNDNPIREGQGFYIKNDIKKISANNIESNKQKKNNFIINTTKYYSNDKQYTLYIYYKNINCEFLGFNVSNFWFESRFKLFDNLITSEILGSISKESDKIKYNDKVKEIQKELQNTSIFDNEEKFAKNIKELNKYFKQYKKIKEIEKNYTIKDYKKMIYVNENINALEFVETFEKTFDFKIDN